MGNGLVAKENTDWKPLGTASIVSVDSVHSLLECLIVRCGGLEASDPRDVAYSLLGMSGARTSAEHEAQSQPGRPILRVDYNRPASLVYQDVAKYIMNRDRNLDLLVAHCAAHKGCGDLGLPSWMPDWRNWEYHYTSRIEGDPGELAWQSDDDVGFLRLRGTVVATVQEVIMPAQEWQILDHIKRRVKTFRSALAAQGSAMGFDDLLCKTYGNVHEGDLLALVLGTRYPVVLRPCALDGFIFVGVGMASAKEEPGWTDGCPPSRSADTLCPPPWLTDAYAALPRADLELPVAEIIIH
ncbi:hypothetical protein LTR85_000234 [Meristemomyces frigidus]|nr:hypothetical protein LTR85_000234 [Meristemomyces frigidus]